MNWNTINFHIIAYGVFGQRNYGQRCSLRSPFFKRTLMNPKKRIFCSLRSQKKFIQFLKKRKKVCIEVSKSTHRYRESIYYYIYYILYLVHLNTDIFFKMSISFTYVHSFFLFNIYFSKELIICLIILLTLIMKYLAVRRKQ